MNGYVYKFYGINDELLYIGKTKNINNRINSHQTHGHLPQSAYKDIVKAEYAELNTYADAGILERYYIGKLKPKYNMQYTCEGEPTLYIDDSCVQWQPFDFVIGEKFDNVDKLISTFNGSQSDIFYGILDLLDEGKNVITAATLKKKLNREIKIARSLPPIIDIMREMYICTRFREGKIFNGISLKGSVLTITVTKKMFPVIKRLRSYSWDLDEYYSLVSIYSKTIYRYLSSVSADGCWYISLDEFRRVLSIPEKYDARRIGNHLLNPAIQELKEKIPDKFGDLMVKKAKVGPKIVSLKFIFTPFNTEDDLW